LTAGAAVNRAIETLAPIVAQALASDNLRDKCPERFWHAIEDDQTTISMSAYLSVAHKTG
jgi:hypothetical protein